MREYRRPPARQPGGERGIALAIVLWFLAAMALLVSGIVAQGRVDLKLAQVHIAKAKVAAAGDGAVMLMLERFSSAPLEGGDRQNGNLPLAGRYRMGELSVEVRMVPGSGLLDVFNAPPKLLAALFTQRGGIPAGEAKQLADNVVELRSPARRRGPGRMSRDVEAPLSTPEDLLRVPGFSRTLLDAIGDVIRAVPGSRDRLNWSAMPDGVLKALAEGNPVRAEDIASRRQRAGGKRLWNPRQEDLFRVDAVIQYGGQRWLRRLWVKVGGGGRSELPWQVVRTEPPRVLS